MRLRRNRKTTTTEGTSQMPAPPRPETENRRSRARRTALAIAAALGVTAVMASAAAALPADRAYEMVTPSAKGGIGLDRQAPVGATSPSGKQIAYQALGAFAGTSSGPLYKDYLAERALPAWVSTGVSPPIDPVGINEASPGLTTVGVASDFRHIVVRTNAKLTPDAWQGSGNTASAWPLYVHDVATGSYRLITPPQSAGSGGYQAYFVGGNADYSEVIVETSAVLHADADPASPGAPPADLPKLYRVGSDGSVTLETRDESDAAIAGSLGTSDSAGSNELTHNAVSADGEVVFFASPPVNSGGLPPADLYRREAGVTTRITESENASPAVVRPNIPVFQTATPDGTKALFTTGASLVPEDVDDASVFDNQAIDLYMYTHSDEPGVDSNLTLISEDNDPVSPPYANVQGVLGMSDDGTRVYFVAQQQLVAGGPASSTSTRHLYLWEDGDVSYLGTGAQNTFRSPETGSHLAWGWSGGDSADFADSRLLRSVAPNGAAMLVLSSADLDPDRDNGGLTQVYRYGAAEGELTCVSCPADGSPASAPAGLSKGAFNGTTHTMATDRRYLSADGRRAFFHTATPLVPQDGNGLRDVYMWEDGEVHLISTGRSTSASLFIDASASGDDAFFVTAEPLVGWDDDDLTDLYVARVGGGLPQPPDPEAPCSGEECQGALSNAPAFDGPASTRFEELGDVIAGPPRSLRLRRVTRSQRARLARGRTVGLRVLVGRAGMVRVTVRAKVGGRRRVVARGRKRAPEAGTVWVRVRLSPPARRMLARGKRLAIKVNARSARARESDRATVRLKRPGKRAQRRMAGGRR